MEIGINDLDFYDDDYGTVYQNPNQKTDGNVDGDGDPVKPWIEPTPTEPASPVVSTPPSTGDEDDIITMLLKSRNIEDPTKIKFEDEEGNIQERDWNSLTKEEQFNILNSSSEDSDDVRLGEAEIGLINQLRLNQMSPDEFIAYVKQQGANEYAQSLQDGPSYKVDDLSDDELFIIDLQSRVEDITDEEAKIALDRAKQDQTLFEKQMKGIRDEYKQLEDERNKIASLEQQQADQENFELFKNSVIDSIQSLDKIGGLDIEMDDDDMNEIANFILSTDNAGVNYLAKALDDPQTLVRMAWFALKGDEAIDSIMEYFTDKIKEVSQKKYEEGLKDGRAGKTAKSTVVVKPPKENKQTSRNQSGEISINDLD